jgi:hypothetical protein
MMTPEQKIVASGAVTGVVFMAISVTVLYHLWPAVSGLELVPAMSASTAE